MLGGHEQSGRQDRHRRHPAGPLPFLVRVLDGAPGHFRQEPSSQGAPAPRLALDSGQARNQNPRRCLPCTTSCSAIPISGDPRMRRARRIVPFRAGRPHDGGPRPRGCRKDDAREDHRRSRAALLRRTSFGRHRAARRRDHGSEALRADGPRGDGCAGFRRADFHDAMRYRGRLCP